ncbi:hypothetical protein CW740_08145 [Kangiella profundi]|uniref:Uncharacterized protein n=1 Tax=Kangiella profundi TaxID=1561924 RepID=A0A2K9AFP9_9GAMM|nr:hypothetical protein CW740_08145 [Kangiella profundi]
MFWFVLSWLLIFILIPYLFLVKEKKGDYRLWYLTIPSLIGYFVYYLLCIGVFTQYKGLELFELELIDNNKVTALGYFYFALESLVGSILGLIFGYLWWKHLLTKRVVK